MSGWDFCIYLFPAWKEAVAAWKIDGKPVDQAMVDRGVKSMHRAWLDGCGYTAMYDPDAVDPMAAWEAKSLGKPVKLGPNAYPLYGPHAIRVQWGKWGIE